MGSGAVEFAHLGIIQDNRLHVGGHARFLPDRFFSVTVDAWRSSADVGYPELISFYHVADLGTQMLVYSTVLAADIGYYPSVNILPQGSSTWIGTSQYDPSVWPSSSSPLDNPSARTFIGLFSGTVTSPLHSYS